MKKNLLIFLIAAPLLAFVLVGIKVYYSIEVWKYSGPDTFFKIRQGENFSSINYRLHKKELISSPKLLHRYAQFTETLTKFKSGTYLIKTNSNMLEIVNVLVSGKSHEKSITIPEGKNIFEIGKILERENITSSKEFIKLATNKNFVHNLNIPAGRVEGYLYPNTYQFARNSSAKTVIEIMVKEFFKKVSPLPFENSELTPHEIITLASIVEKETGASFERPIIAGVFLNRLKKRMRLQSDPTTIYGIYENFNGDLKRTHLQKKTPYNTYRINGLPKGPIANPGLNAIKAILSPKKHNYLYFVSQNDGTHIFSSTYKKHIMAVNKFQKLRKSRQGKSWRDLKNN